MLYFNSTNGFVYSFFIKFHFKYSKIAKSLYPTVYCRIYLFFEYEEFTGQQPADDTGGNPQNRIGAQY